jgi:UPF0716 protein FxsA
MFLLLVLLFIVLPIAEIFVIIEVGHAIGPWWTILLLILDSIVGAWLWRWQGRAVWARFQDALANGRMPHREILDGVLVIVGGAFLLTPGFISDIFGLILLIPPSRAVVRRMSLRFFTPATMARVVFVRPNRGPSATPPAPPRHVDQPPPPQLPPG